MAKVKRQTRPKPRTRKKTTRLLDNLPVLEYNEKLKMVVYGRSASGKTSFCATIPGKLLWIICSGGNAAGELRSLSPEQKKRITPIKLENSDQLLQLNKELSTDTFYDGVVLDHASDFQDMALAESLGIDELPAQKDWEMATRDDYAARGLTVKTCLRGLLNLVEKDVVIVAQEGEFDVDQVDDESLIQPSIGAALGKSIVTWLNPAADQIVETFIQPKMKRVPVTSVRKKKKANATQKYKLVRDGKKVEYCLRTAPDPLYTTKFRVPKGYEKPEYIVDPDYDKLMEVINGKYKP